MGARTGFADRGSGMSGPLIATNMNAGRNTPTVATTALGVPATREPTNFAPGAKWFITDLYQPYQIVR